MSATIPVSSRSSPPRSRAPRRPAISSSRTAWRPSTCSPPRPFGLAPRLARRRDPAGATCASRDLSPDWRDGPPAAAPAPSRRRPDGSAGAAARATPARRDPAAPWTPCRPRPPAFGAAPRRCAPRLPRLRLPVAPAHAARLRRTDHGDGPAGDALAAAERPEALGPPALHRHRRPRGGAQAPSHLGLAAAPASGPRTPREQSTLPTVPPSRAHQRGSLRAAARSSRRPATRGSVSGKCWPMSPSPAAPSSASATAWAMTSASLWPTRPALAVERDATEHERPRGSSLKRWTSKPWPTRTSRSRRLASPTTRRGPTRGRRASVILRLPRSPSTTTTRPPHASTSAASSVPVAAGGVAARSAVGPERLRGLHRHQRCRGRVSPRRRRRASTCLTVSVTRHAGHRAVGTARTAASTAAEQLGGGERPGGVVHADDRRRRRAPRASPARTDSLRVAPPATPPSARCIGRRHDDHHAALAAPAAADRPVDDPPAAELLELLGPPKRAPVPAGDDDRPDTSSSRASGTTARVVPSAAHGSRGPPRRDRVLRRRRRRRARTDRRRWASDRTLVRGDVLFARGRRAADSLYVVLAVGSRSPSPTVHRRPRVAWSR